MSIAFTSKESSQRFKTFMNIFIAESYGKHSEIDIVSGAVGLYQEPIADLPFLQAKTLETSDAVLVPHDAYYFSKYPDYLEYLNELSNKKLIIFSDRGDFPKKPKIANSVALRVAINPGESINRKIVIPYNVQSLSFLPYRKLQVRPTVSFVGFIPKVSLGRTKYAFQQSPLHPIKGNGALVRRLTNATINSADVHFESLIRGSYGALDVGNHDLEKNRLEYIKSINESDLIACPRGDANQSARFYETLSAGRIPLIPDSSIIFPEVICKFQTENIIKFQLLSRNIDLLIAKYFDSIKSQSDYVQVQDRLRSNFEKNFRFQTVIKHIFSGELNSFLALARLI